MDDTRYVPRPTIYAGIQMRSRLEAAYAQYLDGGEDDFRWEYEPQAYASPAGQYLPDFRVPRDDGGSIFIEVKPASWVAREDTFRQMHIILASEPNAYLMLTLGNWPDDFTFWAPICTPREPCGFDWCGRT